MDTSYNTDNTITTIKHSDYKIPVKFNKYKYQGISLLNKYF